MATNVSTPQADTECPSANIMYSSLRYKKQEKFAPYIPIAKAGGFTALSGKNLNKTVENILSLDYATFKSQVISYLEPEDQPQYESEEVWDNMRLQVIEALSEDLS